MKNLLFGSCALLLASCATPPPEPGTVDHQQQLADEARRNFLAMKELERQTNPAIAARQAARGSAPAQERLTPVAPISQDANNQRFRRTEWRSTTQYNEETVYYTAPTGPEPTSARYLAYKQRYAQELAKRPEDLTSEEREWVRRHYRD